MFVYQRFQNDAEMHSSRLFTEKCFSALSGMEDVLSFREKGKVVLLGARVGKVADDDDIIGRKTRVILVVISSSPFCVKWNWLHVMADS